MRHLTTLTRSVLRTAAFLLVIASVAQAQNGASAINVDHDGVILKGYDAVAYQTDGQAVPGSPAISAVH